MIRNFFFAACMLAAANAVRIEDAEPIEACETWTEAFAESGNCNAADGMGAPACWKQGKCCVWAVGPAVKGVPGRDGTCDYVQAKCGKPDSQRIDQKKYADLTEEQWNPTPYFEKVAAKHGITYR